ncbi:translation initiation factor IF-2-like [Zingiber officinale]|uniref:translation initiation factor IF-2-like n=1 Tax=Zingiber officinale TaxID=94328 RepID=UPI001C4B5D01|nr:translation initiation factor IF-2-like [Zingiber officinale]
MDLPYAAAATRMEDWRLNLTRLLSEDLLSFFRLSHSTSDTPRSLAPSAEVLRRASEVLPLPLDDVEILRRGRAILARRLLPHHGSASLGAAAQPAPSPASHATSPPPAASSRGWGCDPTGRPARHVFRGARRASERGRAALHRAGLNSSDRGATNRVAAASSQGRPHSDDSDSDNQPLLYRRRRRAASPNPYRGRPAAFRSAPSTADEYSPGDHQNPAPTEPVPEQPPAPLGADADPSQPSSSARHRYRTTIPSEAAIAQRPDAPTSLLMMKGCLGKLQLNDPAQASYALRVEIQALTNQTDRQRRSLTQVKNELRAVREERAASEAGYQQQLAYQAQELQSKDTLLQERGERLEVQAAQLETQAAELRALKAELSQSRAALSGVSTALTVYQEGEEDRCLRSRMSYLTSPEFLSQAGARFSATIPYTAAGVIRQLHA